jgi:hypothetical protein
MTYNMTQVLKTLTILTMCLISLSSIIGCSAYFGKPIEKIGHHLQKIKDIDYKLSLKKINSAQASKRMMSHMEEIKQLDTKISDKEPIKALLTPFIEKWNTEDDILVSLTNGDHLFMTEVNVFFIRGHVKYKDGWKTLFPIFKP